MTYLQAHCKPSKEADLTLRKHLKKLLNCQKEGYKEHDDLATGVVVIGFTATRRRRHVEILAVSKSAGSFYPPSVNSVTFPSITMTLFLMN